MNDELKYAKLYGFCDMARRFFDGIKDDGSNIDTGGGFESRDIWVTVGGVEYIVNIKRSNKNK